MVECINATQHRKHIHRSFIRRTLHQWRLSLSIAGRIAEFEIAHLEGAINIPLQHLSLLQDSFPCKKDDVFYVYCRTGNRSCTFVTYLRSIGYSNCQSIAGGFELWGAPPSC